ncbi:MAG: class I SAM-dependent methyltransferase [bacterium]
MSRKSRTEFLAEQRTHFAAADVTHFEWQTHGAGFAEREHAFLQEMLAGSEAPLLEIGAGEGGNLFHLAGDAMRPGLHVGLDAFVPKLHFAAAHVEGISCLAADAGALPFRDGAFATVLIRDVLHHLAEPRRTLEEAVRVLRPGGHFILIEPNARNPLICLQMALVEAERGASRSREPWLRGLLDGLALRELNFAAAAPFPLDRVVLHPEFGLPSLGRSRAMLGLLSGVESLVGALLGRARWSYWIARARKKT